MGARLLHRGAVHGELCDSWCAFVVELVRTAPAEAVLAGCPTSLRVLTVPKDEIMRKLALEGFNTLAVIGLIEPACGAALQRPISVPAIHALAVTCKPLALKAWDSGRRCYTLWTS